MATSFRPKFITFDCYGTLTNFDVATATRKIYSDTLKPDAMNAFLRSFSGYRVDEVLGAWKPYADVFAGALERTCKLHQVPFRAEDALEIYNTVPTWGPHPDVPAGLTRVAKDIPLVILSNAMNDQIMSMSKNWVHRFTRSSLLKKPAPTNPKCRVSNTCSTP